LIKSKLKQGDFFDLNVLINSFVFHDQRKRTRCRWHHDNLCLKLVVKVRMIFANSDKSLIDF
jgi:hypothetical protein